MEAINTKGKGWSKGIQYVNRELCKVCGKRFYVATCVKARSEMSGSFCSKKCKGIWMTNENEMKFKKLRTEKERLKIELQKKETEVVYNNCKNCGAICKAIFCNQSCYNDYKSKHKIQKKIFKCKKCGENYNRSNTEIKSNTHFFCSISCSKQYFNMNMKTSCYTNSLGGKREDLNNMYFRSRWEANYARYLNFLITHKQIYKWEYEPDTFVFKDIKRGTRSYMPDFKVFKNEIEYEYHEVKGYNSPESQTKLKRMAKYYPNEKVILIDKDRYMQLHKQLKSIIKFWEIDEKKKYAY